MLFEDDKHICRILTELDIECGERIAKCLTEQFPSNFDALNNAEMVDAITTLVIGSQQTRFGSLPNSESIAAIQNVIRHHVERDQPIPILCPFGSKKTLSDRGVDVAELAAFKTIVSLNERIKSVYSPGTQVVLRVEDLGGYYLFADEGKIGRSQSNEYVETLRNLFFVTGMDTFAHFRRDSDFTTESEYLAQCRKITPVIHEFITDTNETMGGYETLSSWKKLQSLGWKGNIPSAQRNYFRDRYHKLYGCDHYTQDMKLSEYLAGSLARYQLNATGECPDWEGKFLHLNFCPPIPGTPSQIANTRLYYRTVPLKFSTNHLPAWRAKGVIRFKGDKTTIGVVSWNEAQSYLPCWVLLKNQQNQVAIRADYKLS